MPKHETPTPLKQRRNATETWASTFLVARSGNIQSENTCEQTPRKIRNGPKHLVAFALPTGGHLRLVPPSGPGGAERAPRGTTRLIVKKDQAFAPLGRPDNRWPLVLQPDEALGCVEMVRHKTRLLERKPSVVQQRA